MPSRAIQVLGQYLTQLTPLTQDLMKAKTADELKKYLNIIETQKSLDENTATLAAGVSNPENYSNPLFVIQTGVIYLNLRRAIADYEKAVGDGIPIQVPGQINDRIRPRNSINVFNTRLDYVNDKLYHLSNLHREALEEIERDVIQGYIMKHFKD